MYKLVAHRGYSAFAPENTMAACELAVEKGFEYIEIDVRFTKDNVAVMIHDADIDRTSNGEGRVSSYTYAELLKFDFGSWHDTKYKNEKIPLFEDFIKFCAKENIHPYIELKEERMTMDQVRHVLEITQKYLSLADVTFISFDVSNLLKASQLYPQARLGILGSLKPEIIKKYNILKNPVNQVFLDVSRRLNHFKLLEQCHAYGIQIEAWTIDDEQEAKVISDYGITGITTNKLVNENK